MSQVTLPSPSSRASPTHAKTNNRQSMPPPQRVTASSPPASSFVNQTQHIKPIEPTPEEEEEEPENGGLKVIGDRTDEESDQDDAERAGRTRKGTMSKNFRFPPTSAEAPPPPVPDLPPLQQQQPKHEQEQQSRQPDHESIDTEDASLSVVPNIITPSAVEVPPPPPVEKERSPGLSNEVGDEELGETEEISLT